jgi:beta-xylosidase
MLSVNRKKRWLALYFIYTDSPNVTDRPTSEALPVMNFAVAGAQEAWQAPAQKVGAKDVVSAPDQNTDSKAVPSPPDQKTDSKAVPSASDQKTDSKAVPSASDQKTDSKAVPTNQEQPPGNPLFPGADPDVVIADKSYWVYPTGEGNLTDSFYVHSSTDLKNWSTRGPVLSVSDIDWIKGDGQPRHDLWAPGIIQENNKYYLYYSMGVPDGKQCRIGVAVSDTPDGKFKDIGKPLVSGGDRFQAIDPMVFEDPKTGDHLLYCGGAGGTRMHVYKLKPDMVSIEKEIPVDTPKNFTEGAFMHYRDGKYYMSYSHGLFFNPDYSVCYSTSDSPTGPWTYKGKILQSNEEHLGPGHHAFLQNPTTGDWYIAYHRWNGAAPTGRLPSTRSVAIDKLEYDKNGDILPVKMTNTGVDPAPI